MNKEIKFKAVSFNAIFIASIALGIATIFITEITHLFKNTVNQTYFIITSLSIAITTVATILSTQEKMISLFFKDTELWLTKSKATSPEKDQVTKKWIYSEIKNYNIYSLSLFTKRTGNIVRIRSHKNYGYYLTWVSSDKKGEFVKEDFEELKNIFRNKLKLNQKKEFSDILVTLLFSILPQIAGVLGIITLAGVFYYICTL